MNTPTNSTQNEGQKAKGERKETSLFPISIAVLALLFASLPYLFGMAMAGDRHFLGLGANIDDAAVYLSWMRQGETGALHVLDRFTTDPQTGQLANPLFLLLGLLTRFTGLPLIVVFHLARLGFGFALLMLIWKFIRLIVAEPRARTLAYLFVCFSSGLGWLPFPWEQFSTRPTCTPGPLDLWQPEAITFLSLYLNPLFLASMCLQVGILMLLLLGERANRARYAVYAGLCGLLLSLVHSYDVLTLSAIWLTYVLARLLTRLLTRQKMHPASLIPHALIAGAITAPGVFLIYHQFKSDPLFHARANVETLTTYPQWLLLGYGLTFCLALYAIILLWCPPGLTKPAPTDSDTLPVMNGPDSILLLTVWLIVNIAVAYLPGLAFQRKLLQGAHFPIAILAGVGAYALILRFKPALGGQRFALKAAALTLILALTNIGILIREITNFHYNETQTHIHRPYILPGEFEALQWIAANTPPDTAVQPIPWQTLLQNPQTGRQQLALTDMTLACFTPALTGRAVYCGHFGETPDYGSRLVNDLMPLAQGKTPDETRRALLQKMRVQYLIFSQKALDDAAADILFPQFRGHIPLPSYLRLIHSNSDADVYAVVLN